MRELTVAAAMDQLPVVTAFLDEELERRQCPSRIRFQLEMAVDELISNIVRYGYGGGAGTITVQLEWEEAPTTVVLTFLDRGVPYDPLQREDPDLTLSAEQRQTGGLGIFLVKQFMDRMEYRFVDGQNMLTLWKSIS